MISQFRSCAIPLATLCLFVDPAAAQSPLRIQITEGKDTITIVGTNVLRSTILRELRTKHGVDVRGIDIPDARVSPQISAVPLDEGIRRLLPAGTKYLVRASDGDVADRPIVGPPEPKRGPVDVRPPGLPQKGRNQPLRPGPTSNLKRKPTDSVSAPPQGQNLKPVAGSVAVVPPGSGPKLPTGAQQQPQDSTLRLSFTIRADTAIRATGARFVAGATPVNRLVQGPYLYEVTVNDRRVAFGTLLDPLEQQPVDSTRTSQRASEGQFAIWIPGAVLRAPGAAQMLVTLFDARGVTLPRALDEDSFTQARARARALQRVALNPLALIGRRQ